MATISFLKFTDLYIIESLAPTECKSGTRLHEELSRIVKLKELNIEVHLLSANSIKEWNEALDKIKMDILNSQKLPMLHIEAHGLEGQGLVLSSGTKILWKDFIDAMREINILTENNLLLTMATCFALEVLFQPDFLIKPCPFFALIASRLEITLGELQSAYQEFYIELFNSFDYSTALSQLYNIGDGKSFSAINACSLFKEVYTRYLKTQFSPTNKRKRARQAINTSILGRNNRKKRRENENKFIKILDKSKESYYREHIRCFLMMDTFKSCKDRFRPPTSVREFLETSWEVVPNVIN